MRNAKSFLISLLALTPLMVPILSVQAQAPAAAPSGPIDIRANEQEFAEGQVIAKGNVRVTYQDSVVVAPLATLFKDAAGNPQRAIFTGHPHLTQGTNKIDSDTLTFEILTSKIIATGHAHSEVISSGGDEAKKPKVATNAPSGVVFPTAESDAQKEKEASLADELSSLSKPSGKADKSAKPEKQEKIITDSDRQEYDRASGRFEAMGNVRVQHGEIFVKADKLQLIYGLDSKPEAAVFTGNVDAMQGKNSTKADTMTYSLATKRLQATGHVKSTVIQENKDGKGGVKPKNTVGFKDPVGMPSANAATATAQQPKEDVIVITSDSQDYSRETGRMSANGNVRVFYQDTIGAGPTAILVKNAEGKTERIVFTGRSQISQPGKRWIADRIEMTMEDKKVIATGNTKALILQPTKEQPKAPETQLARRSGNSLSATRVDPTR